jgi:hypothetical protein
VADAGAEDALPGWRVEGNLLKSKMSSLGFAVVVISLLGMLGLLFFLALAGKLGQWFGSFAHFGPAFYIAVSYLSVWLVAGVWTYLDTLQRVVALGVENSDAGMTLTLRRYNGHVQRVPFADINSVRVTRESAGGPGVREIEVRVGDTQHQSETGSEVWVPGTRYRSAKGPEAGVLLSVLEASGVSVTMLDYPDD